VFNKLIQLKKFFENVYVKNMSLTMSKRYSNVNSKKLADALMMSNEEFNHYRNVKGWTEKDNNFTNFN